MKHYIDKKITIVSAVVCILFISVTLVSPQWIKTIFDKFFNFFIQNFGWAYMACVTGFVVLCFGLAVSKYGNIKLGQDDDKPEFTGMAWFSMLFAAGMGIGIVFWGVAEPIYHFASPPFAEPNSQKAASDAMRTVLFHWGIHPWACYGVVAMALAYSQFRKGNPALISWTFEPVIGKERVQGTFGKVIDSMAVVITLFGVATSLGLGALQVTTGLNHLYGISSSTTVSIVIIAMVTILYILSAVTGIDRGIKILSNTNMILAFLLMLLVLVLGPTRYILNALVESIGNYLQNIVWLSFFIDASGEVEKHTGFNWCATWTLFYWAWWLTWAPFVGAFIARISKGRTIREFILGILLAPTLMCAIWFNFLGGTAIWIESNGGGGISEATLNDVTTAIFVLFNHLPMGNILSLLSMVIVMIFFITSADSATFVVGMMTSGGELEPGSGLKVFWGIICSTIAAMLLLAGGLKAVQSILFVVSFPFLILMVVMAYSLLKQLICES